MSEDTVISLGKLNILYKFVLQQGRGKGAAFKRQRSSVGVSERRRGPKPKVKRHGGDNQSSKDDDSDDHRATTVITTVKDEFTLGQVPKSQSYMTGTRFNNFQAYNSNSKN